MIFLLNINNHYMLLVYSNIFRDKIIEWKWKTKFIAVDTQSVQRDNREKYKKSNYDISIEY